MSNPAPDLDAIYSALRVSALAAETRTYTQLSQDYQALTGVWFEPHGSWDAALGELNRRLHAAGAPALLALVVLKASNEPGGVFWGSAPNVPPRPKSDLARVAEWSRIVKTVHAHAWPAALP